MRAEKTKHLITGQRPIVTCSAFSGYIGLRGARTHCILIYDALEICSQRSGDGTRDVTDCVENCSGNFVKILWVSLALKLCTSNLKQPHLCIQIEAA